MSKIQKLDSKDRSRECQRVLREFKYGERNLSYIVEYLRGFPKKLSVKESAYQGRSHRRQGFKPWVGSSSVEEMAIYSRILAKRIPWTE